MSESTSTTSPPISPSAAADVSQHEEGSDYVSESEQEQPMTAEEEAVRDAFEAELQAKRDAELAASIPISETTDDTEEDQEEDEYDVAVSTSDLSSSENLTEEEKIFQMMMEAQIQQAQDGKQKKSVQFAVEDETEEEEEEEEETEEEEEEEEEEEADSFLAYLRKTIASRVNGATARHYLTKTSRAVSWTWDQSRSWGWTLGTSALLAILPLMVVDNQEKMKFSMEYEINRLQKEVKPAAPLIPGMPNMPASSGIPSQQRGTSDNQHSSSSTFFPTQTNL